MFLVEIAMAARAGSAALTADSIDFLEDAALSFLALVGAGLSARGRFRLGAVAAVVLLIPTAAVLPAVWVRLSSHSPPAAALITATASVAFATNLLCAALLARHRSDAGSLVRAAFLSARNDVAANLAAIGAGGLVALTHSGWPDIAVGVGVGLLNGEAAWDVWRAARKEGGSAATAS